ncbi:hypothetical protein [Carnobacterium maltaromaticum]|uniref:hypothetical protein n=1 Tax=Carnobacterium maltaromaticum TaxID=2751 RepID=UPI0012FCEC16|nr:hypothetical protein [Carnobacterium maltaromaticum]
MIEYFTAHEALEKVEGLNSLSTLNKWANFIQKECDYQFHYDYIQFASHTRTKRTINHRKTRMFTMEEIQKFQQVIELIPTLGRDTSLRKIFDKHYLLDTMNHNELMAEIINQVEIKLSNKDEQFQFLTKKYQHLEKYCHRLEQRLSQFEETFTTQEQTSSGWFRRKR